MIFALGRIGLPLDLMYPLRMFITEQKKSLTIVLFIFISLLRELALVSMDGVLLLDHVPLM